MAIDRLWSWVPGHDALPSKYFDPRERQVHKSLRLAIKGPLATIAGGPGLERIFPRFFCLCPTQTLIGFLSQTNEILHSGGCASPLGWPSMELRVGGGPYERREKVRRLGMMLGLVMLASGGRWSGGGR